MQDEKTAQISATPDLSVDPLHSTFRISHSALPIWTSTQRRALLFLSLVLLLFLAIESLSKPAALEDPLSRNAIRADEIQDRLDPNTASADALSAIPELGEKRAAEIVEYREKFILQHPGQRAFDSADDLLRLKGFGLAIVSGIRGTLYFPQLNSSLNHQP